MHLIDREGNLRARHHGLSDYKKSGLVTALAKYFECAAKARDGGQDQQVKGRDCLPDAMRFGREPGVEFDRTPESDMPNAVE